ncbi:MAG: helix-turn-helix domain-containing protein [Clostridia bacterium]|nr:helix-turn-helix domain-containing protein [Clostridia bacterium]
MDGQKFNENFKRIMRENNLTQKQLSVYTGIPASSIASWFGKQSSSPSIDAVIKIADFLNVTIDYLIGREGEDGTIIIDGRECLSDSERGLIAKYRELSPKKQSLVNEYVATLLEDK